MKIHRDSPGMARAGGRAFTLVEVVFGMAIVAVLFVALYSGLTGGYALIRLTRENTRATQILVEKMETIRLYNWDQINEPGFMLTNFIVSYFPMGGTNNAGTLYTGRVTVASVPLATTYVDDMKKVTVSLNWHTGNLARRRTISTFISRYGLQNYVF